MSTAMTGFGRIAFIYDMQFFPIQQTLVGKHLHKAVEAPIIIDHAVTDFAFFPLFGGLVLLFLDDHLPLGKITDDNSSFSQFARDEMGCFVQTVLLLLALLFRDTFVRFREMNIPMGLFLAPISLGTDFVQLFVIPLIAFEPTDMVEPASIAIAGCQCLYAKVKGHNALLSHLLLFLLVDKRAVVVSSRIFGNSNFLKLFGWWLGQMRHDIGITFWSPIAASTSRKDD